MKKIALLALSIIASFNIWAQGLLFETGTFQEALDKAKAENKMVFLDVYTTWCGPCKQMAAKLFPDKDAGSLYNKHFVNYKIDAEKGDGIDVAERYHVGGYPTNLFLKPDGSVVYTVMGAGDLPWFLNNAEVAIAEGKDPMSWKEYEAKVRTKKPSKEFLKQYIVKGSRLGKNIDAGWDALVPLHFKRKVSDDDLLFMLEYNKSMDNEAYQLLAKNSERVNGLKKDVSPQYFNIYSESILRGTIEKFAANKEVEKFEQVVLGFVKNHSPAPVSDALFYKDRFYEYMEDENLLAAHKLSKTLELMSLEESVFKTEDEAKLALTLAGLKQQLKAQHQDELAQTQYIDEFLKSNPQVTKMTSFRAAIDLNQMAWEVWETKNKKASSDAVKWSERALSLIGGADIRNRAAILDTYAHVLYLDRKHEPAAAQATQALNLAKSAGDKELEKNYTEVLAQIKAGTLK